MTKNDDTIKELLAKVEAQTKGLGSKPRGTWVTNGVFKYNSTQWFNINVEQDFATLADALGVLLSRRASFEEACKRLGIPAKFKWDGYTLEEWEEDFKMRIAIVEYDKRRRMLEATKAKLKGLVSDEARTEMELKDIAALLG